MKITLQIFIILIFSFSCSCSFSKRGNSNIDKIELGMTVDEVIKTLDIKLSDVYIIQEPPLIYRGINVTLNDSTEIGISFDRTPANSDDLSKEKGLEIVKKLKIKGFVWKKKNGESGIIGEKPKFWIE